MDISKSNTVRRNKQFLKESDSKFIKPKITRVDKIVIIVENLGGKATFTQILDKIAMDKGNLSGLLKNAVTAGRLDKNMCPHCEATDVYYTK